MVHSVHIIFKFISKYIVKFCQMRIFPRIDWHFCITRHTLYKVYKGSRNELSHFFYRVRLILTRIDIWDMKTNIVDWDWQILYMKLKRLYALYMHIEIISLHTKCIINFKLLSLIYCEPRVLNLSLTLKLYFLTHGIAVTQTSIIHIGFKSYSIRLSIFSA